MGKKMGKKEKIEIGKGAIQPSLRWKPCSVGKRIWAWSAPEAVKKPGHLWSAWFAPGGCSLVLVGVRVSGNESTGHSHHLPVDN